MARILTLELSDEWEQALAVQAARQGVSIETLILEWLTRLTQTPVQAGVDPLADLSGTLTAEANDIGEHHDVYLGDALQQELKNAQ